MIIAGTILNLFGQGVYYLTHPFDLGETIPSFQKLIFGLLATFAFFLAGRSFEVPSAKRVFNRCGLIPRSLLRYSGLHEPLYP